MKNASQNTNKKKKKKIYYYFKNLVKLVYKIIFLKIYTYFS